MRFTQAVKIASIALVAMVCVTPARADFTVPVLPGPEVPLVTILDTLYGAGNYTRIDDFNSPINDQLWWHVSGSATAQAKYAGFVQDFGFLTPDNVFHLVLNDVAGNFLGGGPVGTFDPPTGQKIRLALDPSGAPLWSSRQSDNGGNDHMITFRITGNGGGFDSNVIGNYVVCWEDKPLAITDRDYNDLVVEINGVHPVPEPASLLMAGAGIAGLILARRRKNAKA